MTPPRASIGGAPSGSSSSPSPSPSPSPSRRRSLAWFLVVGLVVSLAVVAGTLVVRLAGLPQGPEVPLAVRATGSLLAVLALVFLAWTFVHHPPPTMAVATGRTIEIAVRRLSAERSAVPRLITSGPYRIVRNPTYLGAFLALVGAGLAVPYIGLAVAGFLLLPWWHGVVIPAEEKELQARFGEEYRRYRETTPRFVPWLGVREP
ncbi:MAG: methyltransferase family protein [Methanobacteriota archaeon]